MKQEDRELLLKDLSARLPYGVKFLRESWNYEWDQKMSVVETLENIDKDGYINSTKVYKVWDIKPYLRPIDSMTEEEKKEIYNWLVENDVDWFDFSKLRLDEILISFDSSWLLVNWLNENHFDYRGLIEKGLAIEAPKRMYNY